MKTPLLFVLCFSIGILRGQTNPEPLSLEEAVAFGIENNRMIVNANLDVQKAYKEKWSTIAIGLPQISANIDYQNFLRQPVSLIPAQFFGGVEGDFAEVSFGTKQNLIAGARITQLLFDGSYLVGLEATKVYLKISENVLEKTILEVRKNIISTYGSVLLAQKNIEIIKNNKVTLEANLLEIKELFKNGFEEEESVEQLRLTLSQMNTQLQYAENLERISLNMLKLLLGYPVEKSLALSDTVEDIMIPEFIEMELENNMDVSKNIDIKIAENTVDSEALLWKLERSKALPKLKTFITGTYTGNSNRFSFFEKEQNWFGSSLFGVGIELPIFSSLGRSARSQKAKIGVIQAKTNLIETQERIALEFLSTKNEFSLAVATYSSAIENLTLAEKIQKKNEIKYFEGMATSFDLRQSQMQLYSAQSNYIQAIQNVISKKLDLETLLNSSN